MEIAWINVGLGFLEGFALIISPCILPVLPIILSSSLTGGRRRPLGIITGFIIAFTLFTYFSRKLVQLSGVDLNLIRNISFGLLFLLGGVMLSTILTEWFSRLTQRLSNIGANSSLLNQPDGGFLSGLLMGCLIGLIWTPCAGPILAAVIVQTVIQQTSLNGFLIMLAFGIGTGVPLLFIALGGRQLVAKLHFFRDKAIILRKCVGVIIILSAGYMISGSNVFSNHTDSSGPATNQSTTLINGVRELYPAPALIGITAWLNSPPLQLNQLKGKVILIDFWAYSCINCIRTLPYLKDWYAKYHNAGLEIIGVHSPEFDFERDLQNVKTAVAKEGIAYPVALDNDFLTWQNYNNHYWPAHYLIDQAGNVVYEHFGEGDYDITENNIRYLLGIHQGIISNAHQSIAGWQETPETYLGYERADHYEGPRTPQKELPALYTYPEALSQNGWALKGEWQVEAQKIVAVKPNAAVKIHYNAGKVYAVMGCEGKQPVTVTLLLNGEKIIADKGSDVTDSRVIVNQYRLYKLIDSKTSSSGILELTTNAPGLALFTFTFGE